MSGLYDQAFLLVLLYIHIALDESLHRRRTCPHFHKYAIEVLENLQSVDQKEKILLSGIKDQITLKFAIEAEEVSNSRRGVSLDAALLPGPNTHTIPVAEVVTNETEEIDQLETIPVSKMKRSETRYRHRNDLFRAFAKGLALVGINGYGENETQETLQ